MLNQLPRMQKAQGLIPNTELKKERGKKRKREGGERRKEKMVETLHVNSEGTQCTSELLTGG